MGELSGRVLLGIGAQDDEYADEDEPEVEDEADDDYR